MNKILLFLSLSMASILYAEERTWFQMPIGNGHGFQVFDRNQGKINVFLEHPYLYLAPSTNEIPRGREIEGVIRRNLAYDLYFGATVDQSSTWFDHLNQPENQAEYDRQNGVIHLKTKKGVVDFEIYYTSPFGYEDNALIMLIKATSPIDTEISLYAKANMKLGFNRPQPNDEQESIVYENGVAIETGPGGGQMIYRSIGGVDEVGCGLDWTMNQTLVNENRLLNGTSADQTLRCQSNDQVFVPKKNLRLVAGQSQWWGQAILFLNNTPNHPQADLFKDERNIDQINAQWDGFMGNTEAKDLIENIHREWEAWRKNHYPQQLSESEIKLWRQSETVLRMGQVREKNQVNRKNHGMILAALPTGQWQTGWLRDGAYSTVALSVTGHFDEGKKGLNFFLNAPTGVFPQLLNGDYRLSSCRYFGNGMEEADGNFAGPNLETDGWGLVLWAAVTYLKQSCDLAWLDEITENGDSVYEALLKITDDIVRNIDATTGLAGEDCSIWEVHWDFRQKFAYTSITQARGLLDIANVIRLKGDTDRADRIQSLGENMVNAIKSYLVHPTYQSIASHQNVANAEIHIDGSVVEAFNFGLIDITDPVYLGTLNQFYRLRTNYGGYRRLDPALSLVGERNANEYDLSEWVYLNLRIGDAWRKVGNIQRAEEVLSLVTNKALANDLLIPELYHPDTGVYAGVIPMVGYGAGMWQLSQIYKYADLNLIQNIDASRIPAEISCGTTNPEIQDMMIEDQNNQTQADQAVMIDPQDQSTQIINDMSIPSMKDMQITNQDQDQDQDQSISSASKKSGCQQHHSHQSILLFLILVLYIQLSISKFKKQICTPYIPKTKNS